MNKHPDSRPDDLSSAAQNENRKKTQSETASHKKTTGKKPKKPSPYAFEGENPSPEEVIHHKRRTLAAKREITSFVIRLAVLAAFVWVIFFVLFKFIPALDETMSPSIRARDIQLVYTPKEDYHSNDVVVYSTPDGQKTGRIVAIPGDSVLIANGSLSVNGGITTFDNVIDSETLASDSDVVYPLTLQDNEYFILSDQRQGPADCPTRDRVLPTAVNTDPSASMMWWGRS